VLALLATIYGIGSSAAALLQARQLLTRRRSCDVSALLFGIYLGGYVLWLLYGMSLGSMPLVVVNAAGVVTIGVVLAVALSLRGSLWHPQSWRSCSV
jgi:MtN3 and saliva related transmembrane protein